MVVVKEIKYDRMICTIAIRYPHNEVPSEKIAKHELYRRSNEFTTAIDHRAENWHDFRSVWTKGGMVYAVEVEYIKNAK
jgi:butyrate kinase